MSALPPGSPPAEAGAGGGDLHGNEQSRWIIQVPPGKHVQIAIETSPLEEDSEGQPSQVILRIEEAGDAPDKWSLSVENRVYSGAMGQVKPGLWARIGKRLADWPYSWEMTLFGLALLVYAVTRLAGLSSFPIYFFSDEAIQTVLAADLVRDNFKNYEGEFLPTYFYNIDRNKFNLSASVYVQVLPYLLFGKHVFITRAVSALISLLGAAWLGLILRDGLKLPYWWSGTLLLALAPAWFLHSRTAFEVVLMVSFYCGAIYYYLLYRLGTPRRLYLSIALFALAFYSYSPGQLVVAVTGLLLAVIDARYHWQNRQIVLRGTGLMALLALPYLRFRWNHPSSIEDQLVTLNSYWVQPAPLFEKLRRFGGEYLYGLSPGYWFIPNDRDLVRHLMKDYGHMHRALLPFTFAGLALAIWNVRMPAYRVLLVTLAAGPLSAALVQVTITRILVLVAPLTLLAALGLIALLTWLEKRRFGRKTLSLVVFTGLCAVNLWMLGDGLVNGPVWFQEYGLSGMQYGGAQVFGAVREMLKQNPEAEILVTPSWANGTEAIARYFLPDPLPVRLASIDEFMSHRQNLDVGQIFIMTPGEYKNALESGKFTDFKIWQVLSYPNGQPGFYFASMRYVDTVDAIFQKDLAERRKLVEADILIEGSPAHIRHSLLDMGGIQSLWDTNHRSVTRTFEANPYIIEIHFEEARSLSGVKLVIGDTDARLLVRIFPADGGAPQEFAATLDGSVEQPADGIEFGQTILAKDLRIELFDLRQAEPAHVHLWEIEFR